MPDSKLHHQRRSVIVIGCDDIGSAIACVLHRAGAAVVIVDVADPPWARRGRSYTDAWYVGGATLDAIDACFCGSVKSIPAILDRGDMIAATTWPWEGVAVSLDPLAIIDTRAQRAAPAVARRPASLQGVLAVGVGTTRVGGWRADTVIATSPSLATSESPNGRGERQCTDAVVARIDAPHGGRFRTRHQIAERVDAGDVVGDLGAFAVVATMAGVLTALAARGARIGPGHTLAEIDSHRDAVNCFGITSEARAIAHRVAAAVRHPPPAPSRPPAAIARQALSADFARSAYTHCAGSPADKCPAGARECVNEDDRASGPLARRHCRDPRHARHGSRAAPGSIAVRTAPRERRLGAGRGWRGVHAAARRFRHLALARQLISPPAGAARSRPVASGRSGT